MAASPLLQQLWQDIQNVNFVNFFFLILIVHYSLLFLVGLIKNARFRLPPSPPGLPVIGHLNKLGKLPHQSLRYLSKKYGPIMFLRLGNIPTVVVSSVEMAREILTTHDAFLANRPRSKAVDRFFYGCTSVGFSPFGDYWRHVRKICDLELLDVRKIQSFRYVREEEVSGLIERIRGLSLDGSAIDLGKMLVGVSNNIVSRSVIGRKFDEEDSGERSAKLVTRVNQLCGAFCFADYFQSLDWLDDLTKFNARLGKTFQEVDRFLEDVVEDHYVSMIDGKVQFDKMNFTDVLLHLHEEGKIGIELIQDNLKAILLEMLTATIDNISATMEWAMAELMRSPDSMTKAQEEVRLIMGNKLKIDENDVAEMRYLKCIVKETLRLHPPQSLLPRESSAIVQLGGYDIPSKTRVLINAWAIQRDPLLWDNAEEFIPGRFSNEAVDFKGNDSGYMPFGGGCRVCPGISYALTAIEFVLANLLHWFDWKLPDGANPEDLDMNERYGQTVFKKNPLRLVPMLLQS